MDKYSCKIQPEEKMFPLNKKLISNRSKTGIIINIKEEMELSKMSKHELLEKCKELGITKCGSKNKGELIELINMNIHQHKTHPIELIIEEGVNDTLPNTVYNTNILPENKNEDEIIINNNVSYFNKDILNFTTSTKFDLIYLDPPYQTNRTFTVNSLDDDTGFEDIWEDDKYNEWLDKLIRHLNSMLTQNGTIVFHISSENSFIAESVLRKHFKKIQKIYWKRCHGKNTVKNKLGEVIDIIFACSNTNNTFNLLHTPIDENSVWAFKNKDDAGEYSLGALKHDRTRTGYMYAIEKDGIVYENKYGWKQKKDAVEELIKQNRIHFAPKQKNMYVKIYKHEHKGVPLSNLWTDIHSITRTSKDPRIYPTQKPQKLLERIIKLYSNENSCILDPVCGSGTTGFVGDKLNRKCVLCDINTETLDVIKKRFEDKIYNI
jgi:DNA modification methylase